MKQEKLGIKLKLLTLQNFKNSKIYSLYMECDVIRVKNLNELRNRVNKAKGLVVIEGGSDSINRAALENAKVDILLSPEKGRKSAGYGTVSLQWG